MSFKGRGLEVLFLAMFGGFLLLAYVIFVLVPNLSFSIQHSPIIP